jgi:predicted DNA-binding transcriptional regulator YafY
VNRTELFYKIEQMLHERQLVPIDVFLQELEVSRGTFKRDIEYLRDRLHAPILWDLDAGGYRFDNNALEPARSMVFSKRAVCAVSRSKIACRH